MTSVALAVAAGVVVCYVLLGFALWHFQERIVFQPPRSGGQTLRGTSTLSYAASDGIPIVAPIVGSCRVDAPVVLAFHGNAIIARSMIPWAEEVVRRFGGCVVLAEYRGYDGTPGSPTYAGAALDATAALAAVCSHSGVDASTVVLFGHSLGSAIATELASDHRVKSLVLQSPLTSARDMVARWPVVGFRVGWSLVSRVHYDSAQRVRELDVPVFVAHGERDRVIPARMGREVFAAARRKGELLMIATAAHNDVPEIGGEAYWNWLGRALRTEAQ